MIDLLKGYCGIDASDDPPRRREKVLGTVLGLDAALEPILPPILALLDVPVDEADWSRLDPAQRRQRILEGLKRLLLRESQRQPLLLVFEDLHWIDAETQAFLDSFVENLPAASGLLLVNYRPEYQHGWGGKTYYTQVRLDPLPAERANELLRALLGDETQLHPLKRRLIERTEGNPLFLEESVRTLVETGSWWASGGPIAGAGTPDHPGARHGEGSAGCPHRPPATRGQASAPDRGGPWHGGALPPTAGHCRTARGHPPPQPHEPPGRRVPVRDAAPSRA